MNEDLRDGSGFRHDAETTAVRIYGHSDSTTEFPVLKAFQEYLDAEQSKARRRMLALAIFFVVLLVIVVLTFTLITSAVINRNQLLSDRIMEMALNGRAFAVQQPTPMAAPVVNVQQPPPVQPSADERAMRPVLAKLEALEAELARARAAVSNNAHAPAAVQPAAVSAPPASAPPSVLPRQQQQRPAADDALTAARRQAEELERPQALSRLLRAGGCQKGGRRHHASPSHASAAAQAPFRSGCIRRARHCSARARSGQACSEACGGIHEETPSGNT